MSDNQFGTLQSDSFEEKYGYDKPAENVESDNSLDRQKTLHHFRNQEKPFAPGESVPVAQVPSSLEPKNELEDLKPGQDRYLQRRLNEVDIRKEEDPLLKIQNQFREEERKRQQREKEEVDRVTQEAEKKAIHQKELDSNEKANEDFDADNPVSKKGQDFFAREDEISKRVKSEEEIASLRETVTKLEEEIASLKEDFIKLWKEKLDSTPLETTPEEEDVPDWVAQISKEPEETTPQPESTEPEDVEPTPQPEETTPDVIPMPPHTPEPEEQEDENQQIINVDSKDIIDVEPQEQGIIPSPQHEIIDVSFREEENKDIDQKRKERNYKRIALVAGFVTGATTGMVAGSAAIPPIGISVAVAAGATTLGRALVGRGIRNIEGRLQQAQSPEEKASLERRLNSYNTIHRRLGYVKSFLTGGAFGLLAANFFSSTYFGGESILGNQAGSTPDITTNMPASQEVGTGSILESAPPSTPEVGQLPDISDGWLETNQFGWDTSKFGWQGSRLYVPTEGVVPGGAPDLQAKFVDALFNQGIGQNHLMGQEAGSLFNEGLINAAYRGQDIEQVAKATAEALKGLVR
jgi:hypothetical protein